MADYRRASDYRVFHFDSGVNEGLSEIVVMVEGNRFYRYERLAPERAHHIVDLLRNEDAVWVELDSGLLQVAFEPVGEGELV